MPEPKSVGNRDEAGVPILVTGATGTVGSEVVRQLREAGYAVRAGVRDVERASRRLGPATSGTPTSAASPATESAGPLEIVRFDVTDPGTRDAAYRGVERMFLLRPPQVAAVKRDLLPSVDAALAAGVTHVTFLSVQGADRNPLLPHAAVERYLSRSTAAWTFLRPGYFFQNLVTVHGAEIRDGSEIFVPAGRGRTAFVDARDVATAAALALTGEGHERQAYELTGRSADTYAEVAQALTEVLGRRIRYPGPGAVGYVRASLRRGIPLPFVLVTLGLYTTARLGLAGHLSADLELLLGRPPIDLRRFVADHLEAWQPG